MLARERIVDSIRNVYALYGFIPLQTPAIEHSDVLFGSAGETSQKEIFRVESPEGEHLGLRFDLTVPLARFIAQHPEIPKPFRRYQVSPVWRGDKPGKGRYREFTQFDIDSVGVPREVADAEIIACMCDALAKLGLRHLVRFSSRAILNLLLHFAGIEQELGVAVFRVIDKLEKIGLAHVRQELMDGYDDESGARIAGLGLRRSQVERIERFLALDGTRAEVIDKLRELFRHVPDSADEIAVIHNISEQLRAMGYGDDRVSIDLSIARGLSYYTGVVFEAIALDAPEIGAIIGGGRYDDLVERFGGGRIPATGASIGVDRLIDVMDRLGIGEGRKATARVLVTNLDPSLLTECLAMTQQLRDASIPAELYLGAEGGLKKQLRYGDYHQVPLALLYGSNEDAKGTVTIKDMVAGRKEAAGMLDRLEYLHERKSQYEVPRAELIAAVRRMLAEIEGGGG
jgi:histidyl-tRNA synthetase